MHIHGSRVLITGGAGFIGSHLVDKLIEEGPKTIVVADDLSLGKERNLAHAMEKFPIQLYVVDASDFTAMMSLVEREKPDIVFSLATLPLPQSLVDPLRSSSMIFRLAATMCELTRIFGFRLVHLSSSEVYGDGRYFPMDEEHPFRSVTPYAASKAAADLLIGSHEKTFGIEAVIARPFNTYGPRQNWGKYAAVIPKTMKRIFVDNLSPIVHGDGKQARDFSHVLDVVEAIMKIAMDDSLLGRIVNIGSGKETSVNELMEMLISLTGFSGKIQYGPTRLGDLRKHRADVSKLEGIGFSPRFALEEGLKETAEWFQKELRI